MCKEHERYYLNKLREEEQAQSRLTRALDAVEQDPENVDKLYDLARVFGDRELYQDQLRIYQRILAIASLAQHHPDSIIIRNGAPLERNSQLCIADTLTKIALQEGKLTNEQLPALLSEYLKAIEIQPVNADEIYRRIAGLYILCQRRRDAVHYYRKIKSINDVGGVYFISYFAKCLVELATEEAAAKQRLPYQINALYHEALPLLRRALVDDMDNDKNLELKEYLARALDGVNEREEAQAIRNKIDRAQQRKEERTRNISESMKLLLQPLPQEFQNKFDKLYHEEQQILKTRYGLDGGSLTSLATTALELNRSEDFVRHVEEIALEKLKVDSTYMKILRAAYRQQRYNEDKAALQNKRIAIPDPHEERTKSWLRQSK